MLIAGVAFARVAGSGSFGRRREREGVLVTDCVRGRSEGGTRSKEDWDFTLVDIVRGRAAGDFGTRGVEGEVPGRGEGLAGPGGRSRVVERRAAELERGTGKRDFEGLGRFERLPVEDAIRVPTLKHS
jgi:hypothetical protein